MESEELKNLAAQLRQPQGTQGLEVAEMMHASNIGMTKSAIQDLALAPGDHILELGHGNAAHLEYLFAQQTDLEYSGLEMSGLMHKAAQDINQVLVADGKADFFLYEGQIIPFAEGSFDKIFTVNTLYFWADPPALLAEIYRVLKLGGRFSLSFAQAQFMEQLPFTQFDFELYDTPKAEALFAQIPFREVSYRDEVEAVATKLGNWMERTYAVITAIK